MSSLKLRYPDQLYAICKVKITSSNPTYLCTIISDHGFIPKSFIFDEEWPHRVHCIAYARIPTYELPNPLEGDWSGAWIHIKFLTEDEDLIKYTKYVHHISTNGADISFITQNNNNVRPSIETLE